jgi:hypothetical protein
MGAPTSSYATACVALRVSGALKPHHHDKVETPSLGIAERYKENNVVAADCDMTEFSAEYCDFIFILFLGILHKVKEKRAFVNAMSVLSVI